MGFLMGLFWFVVVIAGCMAAGWLFRTIAIAVTPKGVKKELRTAPLTASFGMLMIIIYILVAVFAPLIAPFPERMVVGPEYMPWDQVHLLGTDNLVFRV